MTLLHRFASIVRLLLGRDRADRDLDAELQAFVDLAAADKEREGLSAQQARRLAVMELGGVEQAKERIRGARHGARLDELAGDIRYAFRMFAKHRGFTAVVVTTLMLGIGANTAIFSLIDALMLRALPVRDPHALVLVTFSSSGEQQPMESFSHAIVRALADQRDIFAAVAGFSGTSFNVGAPGAISRVKGALVTGDYYTALGLQPAAGRLLTRDDDEAGAPLVAVISDGYWERQFARRGEAIGDILLINAVPVTIVGVSPRGFVGANVGSSADITMAVSALAWVEPDAASLLGQGNFWLRVLARPRDGLSRAESQARLAARWRGITEPIVPTRWPSSHREDVLGATPGFSDGATGWTYLREIYARPLLILMAIVGIVLLIACANVAGLLLARASSRRREIAVRLAIGAGRARIVRQLLIESVLLAFIGALGGSALAWLTGNALVDVISSGGNAMVFDLTPNLRILGFTTFVAALTAVLFGVAPALQTTAFAPSAALREESRTSTSRSRLLPSLVSAQIALSLVLMVGAALFVRTLQNLHQFDPGFSAEGVLLVDLARRAALPADLVDDVRRVPGVLTASLSTHTPLSGSTWSEAAVPAGQPIPERDTARFVGAAPQFFETMRIHLLAGREFLPLDSLQSTPVAIVNERYAERFFAGSNPLGQHLSATVRGRETDLEIIGVARNTHETGLRAAPQPTVYVSYAQLTGDLPTSLAIRASGRISDVALHVKQLLQSRLPNALIDIRPLSVQVAATMVQERMMAMLAGAFGSLALLLAAVGLYGLLSYRVTQRTKEIGIRMAVGAQRRQVVALVIGGAVRLVLIGILIGVPAVWGASRWIQSMLFGLAATDPLVIGLSIAVLLMVAQIAASVPAWRAARVDPLPALRHE
jgi:predicted permease